MRVTPVIFRYDSEKNSSLLVSGTILVLANLVPLVGALAFGWNVYDIVFTYWFENLVIGLMTILRIATAKPKEGGSSRAGEKVFMIPFFIVHYFGFCLAHGAFIVHLLGDESSTDTAGSSILGFWIAVAALFVSHLFSFFRNYIGRGEYRGTILALQMFAPYPRIVVLHLTIIFGAMAIEEAGGATYLLAILVVGKIIVDLGLHYISHIKSRLLQKT